MQRMNPKAHKISSDGHHALTRHKPFKGDCNAAPREQAKKDINKEISSSSLVYGEEVVPCEGGCIPYHPEGICAPMQPIGSCINCGK